MTNRPMTVEQIYEAGWRAAAEWAQRDDLIYDIDSPAYIKDRERSLAPLRAHALDELARLGQEMGDYDGMEHAP